MNILLVHNFYGSEAPSGENRAFEAEKTLLEKNGHDVSLFTRNSDEIRSKGLAGMVKGGISLSWNRSACAEVRRRSIEHNTKILHVHNTFPLISPGVFHAASKAAARVLTLHNYRLFCAAGMPVRNGSVCTECLDKRSSAPSIRYGCYRGNRIATFPVAFGIELHKRIKTWENEVDAFICLSEFQKGRMIDAGLPPEKVFVKPNFYPGYPEVVSWNERSPYVVFGGRLSPEKGVGVLIDAWRELGEKAPELRVYGDGPLRSSLEYKAQGTPVRFFGQVDEATFQDAVARSRLAVIPSQWYEGFPMVIREALAFGTPCAVSDIGPLPSIIKDQRTGVVFDPGDPLSISSTILGVWGKDEVLHAMSLEARDEFLQWYNEESNYRMLMDIYDHAVINSTHRLR